MSNQYPATHDEYQPPIEEVVLNGQEAEAYAAELGARIAEESLPLRDAEGRLVGGVGLCTTLNISDSPGYSHDYGQKKLYELSVGLNSAQKIRTGRDQPFRGSGGQGNYGDRAIHFEGTDDPMESALAGKLGSSGNTKSYEGLHVAPLDDGRTKLRYVFGDKEYTDATGRPGNRLDIDLDVSSQTAVELVSMVSQRPDLIDKVLQVQTEAMGVTEAYWQEKMKPTRGWVDGNVRTLNVVTHNSIHDLSIVGSVSIQHPGYNEEVPLVIGRPAAVSAEPQIYAAATETGANVDHATQAREYVAYSESHGETPLQILADLNGSTVAFASSYFESGGKSQRDAAAMEAYEVEFRRYLDDILNQMDVTNGEAFIRNYAQMIRDNYLAVAAEMGVTADAAPPIMETQFEPGTPGFFAASEARVLENALDSGGYNQRVIDAASQVFAGRPPAATGPGRHSRR